MTQKPRIMVVGSSNTDMVIKTERLPAPGETVLGGQFVMVPGGKGANQAVAAARLGADVTFVARLGMDVFGDKALENFKQEGIDTKYISRDMKQPSGVALIFVDGKGENVIVVAPGANSALSAEDIESAEEQMSTCSSIVLQLEIPMSTVERAISLASAKRVRVILNPAPMCDNGLSASLLEKVEFLIANETEARMLLGLPNDVEIYKRTALRLLDLGIGSAIITLGAKGALVVENGRVQAVSSPRVDAVDTTAAGDAFVGATSVALSLGMSLFDAAQFAGKAAAISVTRMGAQSSLPNMREVEQFQAE